jgi:hypothetical protein
MWWEHEKLSVVQKLLRKKLKAQHGWKRIFESSKWFRPNLGPEGFSDPIF